MAAPCRTAFVAGSWNWPCAESGPVIYRASSWFLMVRLGDITGPPVSTVTLFLFSPPRTGCVSKILTRYYETGSIRPGSIGGSKTKVSGSSNRGRVFKGAPRSMGTGNHMWSGVVVHEINKRLYKNQTHSSKSIKYHRYTETDSPR